MLTALKLVLEDISPTPQVDANVNPLPASTFLRNGKGKQVASSQGQNTSQSGAATEANQHSRGTGQQG